MAQYMKKGIAQRGYQFHLDSPTNQQFVVLDNEKMKKLEKQVRFSFWEKVDDDHSVVRFATSWATRKEDVDELFKLLD